MEKHYKVLVGAYACNPFRGSEEGVGWGWVRALSQHHIIHVITAEFHRQDIEQALNQENDWIIRPIFHYIPQKKWYYSPTAKWKWIENSAFKPLMNLAYTLWLEEAGKLACRLHAQYQFDLAHQLTYVGFRFPGTLWRLPIPFVWGPIGGLENTPNRFLPLMGGYGALYYGCRNLINTVQKKYLQSTRKAFCKAHGNIIAATEGVRKEIRKWYGEESHVICEIGPPPINRDAITQRTPDEPLRICWSGQHLPGKALPLLLDGLKMLGQAFEWELDIIGAGPCSLKWQALATSYGIAQRCRWHGWLGRNKALEVMQNAHVFVITSLKDLTSTVLLEALAQGLPVIALDHCGFSNVLTDECGIKLPPDSPGQVSQNIVRALKTLMDNEDQRRELAHGALRRIRDFSWESKMKTLNNIYFHALN